MTLGAIRTGSFVHSALVVVVSNCWRRAEKKNLAAFHLSFVSGLDTRKQCSRSAAGSLAQERLMQEYLKAETKIDRVEIRR